MSNIERQLKSVSIAPDLSCVEIDFVEIRTLEPEEGEEENRIVTIPYSVEGPYRPHKDLVNSMKKLRKHALQLVEIELADEAKTIGNYNVSKISINGDFLLKQSRVKMVLSKHVERTGKIVSIKDIPEVTMYGESDYHDVDKMTAIIEDVIEECWSYLGGKFEEDGQLPLFPKFELQTVER